MMTELNQQLLQQVRSRQSGEDGWLAALRLRGADRFERLGLPQSVISKVESGERQVVFLELEAVCEGVGITLEGFCRRWKSIPVDFEDE